MAPFTAASHHDVLVLLVQIAVLLVTARTLGEIARRLGQPAVVGEILSGILLGPSLLSGVFPVMGQWLVPEPGVPGYLLEVVSMIGAILLLLITGLETDIALIRRHARTALGVSAGGIIVTFATGFALGQFLPDTLLVDPDQRVVFALFVATAMSISAIPVIAKVLMDLDLMRRDVGQTIIAAGMSDDTVGWILLSIVAGLAGGAGVTAAGVGGAVGRVAVFMIVAFTVGRWLLRRGLDLVQDRLQTPDRVVTFVVAVTFAAGAISQALGLEAVLGAFVAGILFGQLPRLSEEVHHKLEAMALAVFTPIFFATAGLKVDVTVLVDPYIALAAVLVIAVATGGKVVGTYLGARLIGGRDHWTALGFGAGLNARGAMEIIIATIGLELGILTQDMFSIIVVMAMATSLMAPPALRYVLARVKPEAQELERLRREEEDRHSSLARIRRVLLPVRRRPAPEAVHRIESFLLERLQSRGEIATTLLNVAEPGAQAEGAQFLEQLRSNLPSGEVATRVVQATEPLRPILDEAERGYDLLVVGATERQQGQDAVFHPLVDELIRMAPCPTWIVQGHRGDAHWPPRRVLVPTNGSRASRHAAEVAVLLAGDEGAVTALHVVQQRPDPYRVDARQAAQERALATGQGIVDELVRLGESRQVPTEGRVLVEADADAAIVREAAAGGFDLIVLGTDVRPGSPRLFLGPRVERVLDAAPCPVLVVNAT